MTTVALFRRSRRGQLLSLYLPSLVAGVIGKLGPFTALIVLASSLTPREFGVLSAAVLVSQSLSGLFSASILPTVARRAGRLRSMGVEERLSSAVRLPLTVALSSSALGVVTAAPAMAVLTGQGLQWRYAVMGALCGAPVLLEALMSILAGRGRTAAVTGIEGLRGATTFALTLGAGMVWGPFGAATAMLAAEAVVGAGLLLVMTLRGHPGAVTDADSILPDDGAARLTSFAFLGNLMVQVGMWSLQLTLSRSHGLVALAAYGVANRFAMAALLLPTFLTRNLLGHLSKAAEDADWTRYRADLRRYLLVATLLSSGATVVAIVLSQTLFQGLFEKYPSSTAFLAIITASSLPAAVSTALGVILISLGSMRVWVLSDVVFAVVSVAWTLACLATDQSATVLLMSLPVAYSLMVALRTVNVRSEMTRRRS